MRLFRLVCLPAALLAAGCFEGQRTIKVNADGSGTIVDTVKLGAQAIEMRKSMEGMDKTPPAEKKAQEKAKFAEKATAMGPGVTFVSSAPSKDGGEVMTYAFKDVTKLTISPVPDPDANTSSKGAGLTFKLAKNAAGNSVLTVVTPKETPPAGGAKPPAKKPEEVQQEITMMKGMLAGLKVKSVLQVGGTVVKSSAPNTGSEITLMAIDFDQLDAAALQKLATSAGDGPPSAAQVKGIKGITMSDPEVTVEFK